jgi:hypothetical protein
LGPFVGWQLLDIGRVSLGPIRLAIFPGRCEHHVSKAMAMVRQAVVNSERKVADFSGHDAPRAE